METLKKNAANLLKVKTIVTFMMTLVFCVLSLLGRISGEDFLMVFAVVIAFYYGTQNKKDAQDSGVSGKLHHTENALEQGGAVMENAELPEAAMGYAAAYR